MTAAASAVLIASTRAKDQQANTTAEQDQAGTAMTGWHRCSHGRTSAMST